MGERVTRARVIDALGINRRRQHATLEYMSRMAFEQEKLTEGSNLVVWSIPDKVDALRKQFNIRISDNTYLR